MIDGPPIQRAFSVWLDEVRADLPVPLVVKRRTDEAVSFAIGDTWPILAGRLNGYELEVYVKYADVSWDIIISLWVVVQRTPEGYVCSACLPGHQKLYPTRDALWRGELFELFRDWLTTDFAPATHLGLFHSEKGGATWAKLLKSDAECDHAAHCLLLRPAPPAGSPSHLVDKGA